MRLVACETETIRKHPANINGARGKPLSAKEMRYLERLAAERKEVIGKKDEAEVSAIYLRVVWRMEELQAKRATRAVRLELEQLSNAKGLAEGMVVNEAELRQLREIAAERAKTLEPGVERYICTIYRRVHPRLMSLKEVNEAQKKIPGQQGCKAEKEPGLIEREIKRLAEPKRLVEDIVTTGLNALFYDRARRILRYPDSIERCDLVNETKIAVINNVMPRFDPTLGYRLSTYCNLPMNRVMVRYVQTHKRDIRWPVYICEAIGRLSKASQLRRNLEGREQSIEEIRKTTDLPPSVIAACMRAPQTVSLSEKLRHGEGKKRIDRIEDTSSVNPLDAVFDSKAKDLVNECLDVLSPRYARIMRMRYGQDQTLDAIADREGISRERVRQILAKALRTLRRKNRMKLCDFYGGKPPCYDQQANLEM